MKKLSKLTVLSVAILAIAGCNSTSSSESSKSSVSSIESSNTSEVSSVSEESSSESSSSVDTRTPEEKIADLITNSAELEKQVVTCSVGVTNDYGFGASTETLVYSFGKHDDNSALKVSTTSDYVSTVEYLYYNAEGEVEGYKYDNNSEDYSKTYLTADEFDGYNFSSYVPNPDWDDFRGAHSALTQVIAFGEADTNHDYSITLVDDHSIEVTYGYKMGDGAFASYYYIVSQAGFDADTGALSTFSVKKYAPDSSVVVIDDENGTFTISDLAACSYTLVDCSQTVGELVEPNFPYYSHDQWKLTSFGIAADGEPVTEGATVNAELGEYGLLNTFTICNPEPSTADYDFEKFTIKVDDSSYGGYFSSFSSSFSFSIDSAGLHDVSITSSLGASFSFKINATQPAPQSISLGSVKNSGTEEWPYWEVSGLPTQLYLGKSLNLIASVNPSSADQGYTLTCDKATLVEGQYDEWGEIHKYYTFTPTELGEYKFTATSTVDSTITVTQTISVVQAPSLADQFNGTYYYVNMRGSMLQYKLTYTPESSGALAGVATLDVMSSSIEDGQFVYVVESSYSYNYVVNSETKVCTFTAVTPGSEHPGQQLRSASINDSDNLDVTFYESTEVGAEGGYENTYQYLNESNYQSIVDMM